MKKAFDCRWGRWLGLLLALLALSVPSVADDGHDHDLERPAAAGTRRLADGSVFLPKSAQRQLGIRTRPLAMAAVPAVVELAGRVTMDPNAGGKVQAMLAGRITPGPRGLPVPGQAVRRGEILAFVTPEIGSGQRSLAESRLRRLRELADTVPRKTIEEAEAAVANERLTAPLSGVIASAAVVSGQVVGAGETLFEVVQPGRVLVEALAYDTLAAAEIERAYAIAGGRELPLSLLGVGRSLRQQVLPVVFRGTGAAWAELVIGQPLSVLVQTRRRVRGLPVPAAAVQRGADNLPLVWLKTAPERFEPRPVTVLPVDGLRVVLTSGIGEGDRVVVEASALLNQIR